MSTTHTLDPAVLEEIVRRIVEVARPERIILFGSAARGTMRPNSDVDLLVVKAGEYDSGRLAGDIYLRLVGITVPVDVVIARPEMLESYRDVPFLVYAPALREGKELYAA
jgi:predicted nucleotidyltransferase